MKRSLQLALQCLATFAIPCFSLQAQSIPAAVGSVPNIGFEIPRLGGSFNYSLNASELISTGFYNSGTEYTTNLSGDLAYLSRSTRHPFTAVYTGGVLLANSGQPNTTYQELSLGQLYNTKNWNFSVQDAVSYLPESPVTGLSGIPGVGDLGIDPVPVGPVAGIGVLTTYGPRVSNTVTGSASRIITGHISAQGSGYYGIQRFIGDNAGNAVNNSSEGGSAGLTYRVTARDSIGGSYNYTRFSFSALPAAFQTQGATFDYSRQWSRKFVTDVYVGPQFIQNTVTNSRSSTQIAAGASASYTGRIAFYTLNYSRGANNGSGVVPGAFSDNIELAANRGLGRNWSVSGSLAFSRSSAIPNVDTFAFTTDSVAVGAQASRRVSRRLSAYGSYTVEDQSVSGNAGAANAFNGVYQIFAIGVSYSPGAHLLGK